MTEELRNYINPWDLIRDLTGVYKDSDVGTRLYICNLLARYQLKMVDITELNEMLATIGIVLVQPTVTTKYYLVYKDCSNGIIGSVAYNTPEELEEGIKSCHSDLRILYTFHADEFKDRRCK